jgi:hypothetical protein
MFRVILGIIASLFLFSVVRTILGAMKKEYSEQYGGAGSSAAGRPASPAPPKSAGGELKKCPSCGTYHAVGNISGKTKDGQMVHFCSAGCREKFAA